MRRNIIWQSTRVFRRYASNPSAPSSDLLWSSEGFQTRLAQLKNTAGDPTRFPSSLYPRIPHDGSKTTVGEFISKYAEVEKSQLEGCRSDVVTLRGRIKAIRKHGSKLLFLNIEQDETPIQIFCQFRNVNTPDQWHIFYNNVHEGDNYTFTGFPTRTSSGELSLSITTIPTLLAPRLHTIPEQITDEQTLARFPQLDLVMRRRKRDLLRLRGQIELTMQDFFNSRGFVKVTTPVLAASTGGAAAQPFNTSSRRLSEHSLNLRISQELDLKKLIAAGMDRVYEIGPCFRNEGIDATHNPEFSTCEFYQAYATLEDLIGMTEELIKALAENQKYFPLPQSLQHCEFKFKRLSFLPTLEEQIQASIPSFQMPNLSSTKALEELLAIFPELNVQLDNSDEKQSLSHVLDVLASHLVEPLCKEPTFITGYPNIMSPLAKSFINSDSQQELSARAELFINSTEYVNLYEEENDPFQQTKKFLQQASQSHSNDLVDSIDLKKPYEELFQLLSPSQKYYVRVLEMGLPPTGGWGCGMERLTMLLGNAERIGEVLPFGTLRNVIAMGA